MSWQLTFDRMLTYDAGQAGITIGIAVRLGSDNVTCEAKMDTGSTFCIFARKIGEDLGYGDRKLFRLHASSHIVSFRI